MARKKWPKESEEKRNIVIVFCSTTKNAMAINFIVCVLFLYSLLESMQTGMNSCGKFIIKFA